METKVFPLEYKAERESILSNEIALAKNDYEAKSKEVYNNHPVKSKFYDDIPEDVSHEAESKWGGYIYFITIYQIHRVSCILFPILGLIVGFMMFAFWDYEWWCIFAGMGVAIPAGYIARPVYGAILAVVGTPILFPLYLLMINSIERSRNNRICERNELCAALLAPEKKFLENKITELTTEAQNDIALYEATFNNEVYVKSLDLESNNATIDIANNFAESFLALINETSGLTVNAKAINVDFDFSVFPTHIQYLRKNYYYFKSNGCANIDDGFTKVALATALVTKTKRLIEEAMTKDDRYANISITHELNMMTQKNNPSFVSVKMNYYATNERYKPAQSW